MTRIDTRQKRRSTEALTLKDIARRIGRLKSKYSSSAVEKVKSTKAMDGRNPHQQQQQHLAENPSAASIAEPQPEVEPVVQQQPQQQQQQNMQMQPQPNGAGADSGFQFGA